MIARSPFAFSWDKFTFTHFHGFCKDKLNEFEQKWPKSPQRKEYRDQQEYEAALEYFFKSTVPNAVIQAIQGKNTRNMTLYLLMKDKIIIMNGIPCLISIS